MFKEFGLQNFESIISLLKGKKIKAYVTNYTSDTKYEGTVTSFSAGLGEEFALIVLDDKIVLNVRYITAIEILN